MDKPKYLLLQLIFEDDENNQTSMIDLAGMESITMDQVPIIEDSPILGSTKKKIKQLRYMIIVDYGQGLELDEKDNSDTDD